MTILRLGGLEMYLSTGPAILAVVKGPQSQTRYCSWYRSSHGTDFDISEIAIPVSIYLSIYLSI